MHCTKVEALVLNHCTSYFALLPFYLSRSQKPRWCLLCVLLCVSGIIWYQTESNELPGSCHKKQSMHSIDCQGALPYCSSSLLSRLRQGTVHKMRQLLEKAFLQHTHFVSSTSLDLVVVCDNNWRICIISGTPTRKYTAVGEPYTPQPSRLQSRARFTALLQLSASNIWGVPHLHVPPCMPM